MSMPLLLDNQIIDNDPWTKLGDDQELHADQADFAIVQFQRFMQRVEDGEPLPDGVSIGPADNLAALADYVNQLRLICIEFPVFTDGRGYSHARLIRKRLGYTGELRAVGDVRADQIQFMQRLGIDSFDCNSEPNTILLKQLSSRFEHNYQPSYPLPDAS